LKWTEDEDEDGSSAKNLRRTKIFEASLQHCDKWTIFTLYHLMGAMMENTNINNIPFIQDQTIFFNSLISHSLEMID